MMRTPDTSVGFIDLTDVCRGLIYKEIEKKSSRNELGKIVLTSLISGDVVVTVLKHAAKK